MILCGLQAADTNNGQVGTCIAGLLGMPCVTAARKVGLEGDKVVVERSLPDGYEVLEVPCPAVVTMTYEVGSLREPGVEAFMSAGQKPITTWSAADLGIAPGRPQPIRDTHDGDARSTRDAAKSWREPDPKRRPDSSLHGCERPR